MQEDTTKRRSKGSSVTARIQSLGKSTILKLVAGLAVIIILILLISVVSKDGSSRSESYKSASGAAGLSASIEYDCRTSCKQKYNFNVYIFDKNGQQISVVRPDQHGKVNMAMQEGDYVLLIGKQLGKDKLFPQEKVSLKNGKSLELKLKYKEQ